MGNEEFVQWGTCSPGVIDWILENCGLPADEYKASRTNNYFLNYGNRLIYLFLLDEQGKILDGLKMERRD